MNGNPEQNFPESGSTGAYTGTGSTAPGSRSSDAAGANTYAPGAGSYASGDPSYAGTPADAYAPGSVPPPPGYTSAYPPPYGYPAPPPPPGSPNPGLAALLGFIPGVGAMYNGQFPKGIAHIVIFAILTSLANHVSDAFGLLVAGWVFYMVFDAYQTARARRDGLLVPDPFGLNNIGERFGMPHNPNWGDFVARPAPGSTAADPARTSNPYAGPPVNPATDAAANAYAGPSPGYVYGSAAPYTGAGSPYVPPVPPAPYPPGTMPPMNYPDYPEAFRRNVGADMGGAPSGAYQSTYAPIDPGVMPPYPPQPMDGRSGLPVGAIWLIGLGVLALTGSLLHNFYWRGYFFGAASCLILGAVLLVQQTAVTRKLYQPGTAAYRWSLLHQARFGLTLLLIGILQAIAASHVTSWHHLWPYLLIFFGLLQVADRSLYNRMLLDPPVYNNGFPPVNPAPAATANAAAASVSSSNPEGEVR